MNRPHTPSEQHAIEKAFRDHRARLGYGPVEKPWRPGEKPAGERK